jgi:hypothetical protein
MMSRQIGRMKSQAGKLQRKVYPIGGVNATFFVKILLDSPHKNIKGPPAVTCWRLVLLFIFFLLQEKIVFPITGLQIK